MNGKFGLAFVGLIVFALAACANAPPQRRYAGSIEAARAANRPLLIYGVDGAYSPKWASGYSVNLPSNYYVGIRFVNTAAQPIEKLTFTLTADHGRQPVLDANGALLRVRVTSSGPFAPGSAHVAVASPGSWAATALPWSTCLHVSGIEVTYADQTTYRVTPQRAAQYLTPEAKPGVRCAYFGSHAAFVPMMRPVFQGYDPVQLPGPGRHIAAPLKGRG